MPVVCIPATGEHGLWILQLLFFLHLFSFFSRRKKKSISIPETGIFFSLFHMFWRRKNRGKKNLGYISHMNVVFRPFRRNRQARCFFSTLFFFLFFYASSSDINLRTSKERETFINGRVIYFRWKLKFKFFFPLTVSHKLDEIFSRGSESKLPTNYLSIQDFK